MSEFKGKIAVHAITWGHDYLLGFEEAAKLGYKAIEPWPAFVEKFENRENELIEILEKYGLTMTGVYGGAAGGPGRRFLDPDMRQSIIAYNAKLAGILSKAGASHIVFGPGGPRKGPTDRDQLKQAAITINEAAKRTLEFGVKACVHPHLWTELQEQDELDYLMELLDKEVYFAPDTAHLSGAEMDVPAIIRKYKEKVAYIHLKDLTPKEARVEDFPMLLGNEALPVFCELGLGTVDFKPILEAINEIGYEGWMTVEIDQSTSTPYNSLAICRDFVEQQLGIPVRL
ncbi:sugar phosphate isomerase/epimerase family protein [Paenibacillus planticolens]|uniref:TIM barrel protein n=1 Tax=Paenibacillus planticolens TaxID=2654976 RepID=A0ABX1ZY86_9BACL|nr:sugar phosphate isomerase/epimerase [Paenibacillus planticolens]NOV03753.1 TIM barrel protein [Paenibacillus planticolens]